MCSKYTFLWQSPSAFTEPKLQDFLTLVRAGGEVGGAVLEENVRNAKMLVVACAKSCWVAVGALKNPKESYRTKIHKKSGIAVSVEAFPFELGYVFVLPSARKQGLGFKVCEAALFGAGGKGVFATARTNNDGMHKILPSCGFAKAGSPYDSGRGDHQLQLFLRHAAQHPVATDAPQAARR